MSSSKDPNQIQDIREKMKSTLDRCKEELIRTAGIGKKMINAGQINSELNEELRNLGVFIYKYLKEEGIKEDFPEQTQSFLDRIDQLYEELDKCESDVEQLKER
jgi:phosphoglycerate-specific signal transduction histidine kinase